MKLKKILLFILIIIILTPIHTFAVDEGPCDKLKEVQINPFSSGSLNYPLFSYTSYIKFIELSNYKEYDIYSKNTIKNELNGAVYNKKTNTLEIKNINGNYQLETYMMGSDFKIKVVGTNKFSNIKSKGDRL